VKRWLYLGWWAYLFSSPLGDEPIRRIICRARNHPCGPIYYDFRPSATEPDMRCKNCGDEL